MDETFQAIVNLKLVDNFVADENALRVMVVPFSVTNVKKLAIGTIITDYPIELCLGKKKYKLYYEACEGGDVYYNFTVVEAKEDSEPMFLMDDEWGGEKGKKFVLDYA